MKSRGQYL